jgi:hypothetical protein
VRVHSRQRHEPVRAEWQTEVGGAAQSADAAGACLIPTPTGAVVRLLGRSGEPWPGREVNVALRHRWLQEPLSATLATDDEGSIHLGPLPGVDEVVVYAPGAGTRTFDLRPPAVSREPRVAVAGDVVRVPWRGSCRLVELRGGAPALEHPGAVTTGDDVLELRGLGAGDYRLQGDDHELALTVLAGPRSAPWVVATPRATHQVPRPAPVLTRVDLGREWLALEVADASEETRVHVLATPTLPQPAGSADLGARTVRPAAADHPVRTSTWVSGRDLGDELRYVLERRAHPRRTGTLLERPSLLLTPWALRTTTTTTQVPRAQASWAAAAAPSPGAPFGGRGGGGGLLGESQEAGAATSWDFLAEGAPVVANLRPDARGRLSVPLADLPGAALTIVCVDPAGTHHRVVVRPPTPLRTRDRRLQSALPAGRHFVEERRLSATPPSSGARSVRIDTLEALYRALCALGGDPTLAAWDFLPRWAEATRAQRLDWWNEHACHELSLFVAHRDRAFFEEVVRPFLANKLQPGFVDDLLVGRDLGRWLVPWRLARLDAVERALLARARPDARERLVRQLADEVELTRPDLALDDRLVDTLLGSSGETPPPEADGAAEFADASEMDDEAPPEQEQARARSAPKREARRSEEKANRKEVQELYRSAELTREWAEHNWYRTPLAAVGPARVPASRWWRDFAAHSGDAFHSPHLADVARSFSASVCALAVAGVPAAPWFAEAALRPSPEPPSGTILVGQNAVRSDDRTTWEGNEEREKYVADEFLTRTGYTTVVAVTNPSPRSRRLAVLVQIPAGAVPLAGAVATRTVPIELGPWATRTLEVPFYFPHPGGFAQHGARVAEGGQVVAAAPDRSFTVVDVPTTGDAASFAWVSQEAPLPEVVAYLERVNLGRLQLAELAWRLRERAAFEAVTSALAARGAWDEVLWSYALLHRDRTRTAELLDRHPETPDLGPFRSGLVTVDPVDRGRAEHLEYAPLVNARAHRLGARRRVLNDGLDAHWRAFLTRVALADGPTPEDLLQAVHHLFTMDRADEAVQYLARVPATHATLQHTWLRAYAATLAGDLGSAAALVAPHLEHPVPRWRARFQAIRALVDGSAVAGSEGRDARMAELAERQPAFTARIEHDALALEHVNLAEVHVRAHPMDVELLFSREPFLAAAGDRFTVVEPAESWTVALDPSGRTRWPLPTHLRARNTAFEVRAGPARHVVTHLAHDLGVTVSAAYGQLQVRRASTGAPLPGAYVKVFGRQRGAAVFYKDGYTDLLGRFDHATLSTDELDRTDRFALLVLHDDAGATILEAEPPTR